MFINTTLTILILILQKRYRVDPADKEHADRVLEVCARKVCRDAFSNAKALGYKSVHEASERASSKQFSGVFTYLLDRRGVPTGKGYP